MTEFVLGKIKNGILTKCKGGSVRLSCGLNNLFIFKGETLIKRFRATAQQMTSVTA